MRDILILGGIGILSMLAWTVTLDTMTLEAVAAGHGSAHGSHGHSGLAGHMRHGGGHTGHMGMIFPTQLEGQSYLFPGEPVPTGAAVTGGPEHMVAGHLVGPASQPHARLPVQVEREEASIPQPTAPSAVEPDQADAATAQPNPTARPLSPRPPGTAGPGRPMFGRSGPGLPGPGRPASPRW